MKPRHPPPPFRPAFLVCLALLSASATPALPANGARTFVASIHGVKLRPNEYVAAFSVDTWGVIYRAVCHIPPGWYVKAGGTAAPDGGFEGQGTHGVSYLSKERLKELEGLVLITLHGPVRSRKTETNSTLIPPTFDGKIEIGRYGPGLRTRDLKFGASNIRLIPASRCPVR